MGPIGDPSPRGSRTKRETGFIIVIMSLMLFCLLSFMAFAVDLGNWYLHVQQEQRAADSASLGGVVDLPGNVPGALTDAKAVLTDNGYPAGAKNVSVDIHPVPGHSVELYVGVTQEVNNVFLQLLGMKTSTFTRHAIAIYHAPMEFGSPDNVMGQEPPDVDNKGGPASWENPLVAGLQGAYWMQVSGGGSVKVNGGRWTAGNCGPAENINTGNSTLAEPAQNCTMGPAIPTGNIDFDPKGDGIVLHVPPNIKGKIAVDLFDPEMLETGSDCNDPWVAGLPQNNVPNIYDYNAFLGPYKQLPYCPGDRLEHGGTIPPPFTTNFTVYNPDTQNGGGGAAVGGCNTDYPGWMDGYQGLSVAAAVQSPSGNPLALVNLFHKWTRLCDFPVNGGKSDGDYVMRVSTPLSGAGTNDYAVRIAVLDSNNNIDWAQTDQLAVYGYQSRMEIMSNGSNTVSQAFMGRIDPSDSGGTMTLQFFDIGDQSETVSLLPPLDATVNGVPLASFTGCTILDYGGTPAVPIMATPNPSCSRSMFGGEFNGMILGMVVPIPAGYSCGTQGKPTDCWFRVAESYAGQGSIFDYVSFSGKFDSAGLRITQ